MQALWESLHGQERFQPLYPNESVVRFVMTYFSKDRVARGNLRVLDLGCGAGRHTLLLSEQGFQTFAIDISFPGLAVTRERLYDRARAAHLASANMRRLPFPNGFFAGVIAFGVLYYGNLAGVKDTVDEIYRVLAPSGKVQVVTRTTRDYRCGKGKRVDCRSFVLTIEETNEKGMLMCFLTKSDIRRIFRSFSNVITDRTESTTNGWRVDSDWIITAIK